MRHIARSTVTPVALFALVFALHCRGNMGCADSMWAIPTAVSLIDHGDANLDEYLPIISARHGLFTEWHRGHVYTMFPLGTSVLVAPLVPVLRVVARIALDQDPGRLQLAEEWQESTGCPAVAGEPIVGLHSISELILASMIVGFTTVVMFAIGRAEGLTRLQATLLSVIFAFGTSAWSTASRSLWQHGPSMLMLSLALLLQVRGRLFAAIGGLFAFSYVIRPTNAIALLCASAWAASRSSRRFVTMAVACGTVLLVFFTANRMTYGSLLPPYYHPQRIGLPPTFEEALLGDLVSPARGLFTFSPVLIFFPVGVILKVRNHQFSALDGSLVACIVLHWFAIAGFPHWWGGHSYGPRFFTDILPYLVYFLIPVISWLANTPGRRLLPVVVLFALSVAVSISVHAAGSLSRNAMTWNNTPVPIDTAPNRVWDWRDPQFLAGFRRR